MRTLVPLISVDLFVQLRPQRNDQAETALCKPFHGLGSGLVTDDGCGEADGAHEGVGAAVVPGGDSPRLARATGIHATYVSRFLRLTLLAPEMVEVILDGRQRAELQLDDLHCIGRGSVPIG